MPLSEFCCTFAFQFAFAFAFAFPFAFAFAFEFVHVLAVPKREDKKLVLTNPVWGTVSAVFD